MSDEFYINFNSNNHRKLILETAACFVFRFISFCLNYVQKYFIVFTLFLENVISLCEFNV